MTKRSAKKKSFPVQLHAVLQKEAASAVKHQKHPRWGFTDELPEVFFFPGRGKRGDRHVSIDEETLRASVGELQ